MKKRVRITWVMWVYLLCAIAGAIIPWYYNIQYMQHSGKLLMLSAYFAAGSSTPLASSITADFFIGTAPVLLWMWREGRRKHFTYLPLLVAATFLVSFAFSCPLFLFIGEYKAVNNNYHLQK